jgi:hypothetical protein
MAEALAVWKETVVTERRIRLDLSACEAHELQYVLGALPEHPRYDAVLRVFRALRKCSACVAN